MQYQFKFSVSYQIKKSPDGRFFATIGGSPFVWDAQTGKKIVSFGQIKNPSNICFSHSGKLLAVKNTSGKIAIYDMDKLEHIKSFQPTKKEGCGLMFTPDDRFIISADWDGRIYTLDCCSGETEILRDEKNLKYSDLFFDRYSDSYVFHGSVKGKGGDFRTVWKYPFGQYEPVTKTLDNYDEFAYNGPDGSVAAAKWCGNVRVYGGDFEHVIKEFEFGYNGEEKGIKAAWSPDGKLIALIANIGVMQGTDMMYAVRVLEYDTLNVIAEYKLPYACFIEFTEDGQQFLIGGLKSGYCIKREDIKKTEIEIGPDLDTLTRRIEKDGLSAGIMREASEEELMRALFYVSDEIVWDIVNDDNHSYNEAQALDKVQPVYRYTYLIDWFVQETGEGGLSQYIINSACKLSEHLIKAFNDLGLPRHAEIVKKAQALYNSGQEDMDHPDWNRLDEQCEGLDENPSAALYAYLEKETKNI